MPADHPYYDYHPRTLSAGLFAREEYPLRRDVKATLDVAWRHQAYSMEGDRFDGVRFDQGYDFFIPRLGIAWNWESPRKSRAPGMYGPPAKRLTVFASIAQSRREPAFRDLYDAEGAGSVPLFANGEALIRPERVNDYEFGADWRMGRLSLGANLFHMDFRDELVYAGQFNTDLGYPILGNAARSVHQGIELEARAQTRPSWAPGPRLEIGGNASIADNHFVEYREAYGATSADIVSYDGNAIGFFPSIIGNLTMQGSWRGALMSLEAQHVGRIYLDHTESKDASIGPRAVFNARGAYSFVAPGTRGVELGVRVLNVLDRRYETGGYMDYDFAGNLVPHFIPAATRQIMGELRIEF